MAWLTTRASHGSLAVRAGPLLCAALFRPGSFVLGRAALLAAGRLPGRGHGHRHPGLLRLELCAQPRGAARAAVGAGAVPAREDARARRGVAPARGGRRWPGWPSSPSTRACCCSRWALLYVLVSPQGRRWLRRPSLYLGSLVALAVATPVLVWNQQRGWPSLMLHFVERRGPDRSGDRSPSTPGTRSWGSSGRSIRSSSPASWSCWRSAIRRSPRDDRYRFLALASWPVLLFFWVMMARVRDAESHWTMVGYIPLAVAAGGLLDERIGGLSSRAPVLHRCLPRHHRSPAPPCSTPTPRTPPSAASSPRARTTPTATSSTRCTAGPRSAPRSPRRPPRLGPDAVVASCQYALCAHVLTALDDRPAVYCPGPRTDRVRLPRPPRPTAACSGALPPGRPLPRRPPAALLPDRDCRPQSGPLPVERDGRGDAALPPLGLLARGASRRRDLGPSLAGRAPAPARVWT